MYGEIHVLTPGKIRKGQRPEQAKPRIQYTPPQPAFIDNRQHHVIGPTKIPDVR